MASSALTDVEQGVSQGKVSILRAMAENLLGPLTVCRTLPPAVGSGRVVANARVGGLRYLFRASAALDPVLLKVAALLVRPGDTVWDIGGNVGLFSAAASGLAGSMGAVYAVEADIDACVLLARTAVAQPKATHAGITVLNAAVSERSGTLAFDIAKRSRSANSIKGFGSTQMGGVAATRLVVAVTLDLLLKVFAPPQVVKIDVEGAEAWVLAGALELLSTVRPRVFVEVASEASAAVSEIFARHHYHLLDGETLGAVRRGQAAPWNTVAVPAESAFLSGRSRT